MIFNLYHLKCISYTCVINVLVRLYYVFSSRLLWHWRIIFKRNDSDNSYMLFFLSDMIFNVHAHDNIWYEAEVTFTPQLLHILCVENTLMKVLWIKIYSTFLWSSLINKITLKLDIWFQKVFSHSLCFIFGFHF